MTTEGKKHFCDNIVNVVLMKHIDVCWAGHVQFFLTHTPPGYDVGEVDETCIAHVHLYKKVPTRDQQLTNI